MAAETKRGLKSLEPEFAGVKGPPELVERRPLVAEYLLARSVQQDQVSRAPQTMGEAHVPLALGSVETFERQNDGLVSLQPLEDGAGKQLTGPFLDLVLRDPTG